MWECVLTACVTLLYFCFLISVIIFLFHTNNTATKYYREVYEFINNK